MQNDEKKQTNILAIIKNCLALIIFFGIPIFAYRSCTSGYEIYSFFVQASDTAVFSTNLKDNDPRLVAKGRKLTEEILLMDKEIDAGDGPTTGKLRWYTCSGIDCDEGWEISFLAKE